jgi:hypothetical protein
MGVLPMRRMIVPFAAALLTLAALGSPAQAQEATPTLEVTGAHFTDAAGDSDGIFAFGEAINAYLDLHNTGTDPVTGISATLTFERGTVSSATASFPDAAGGETVTNTDPFVFSYGEPGEGSLYDGECFVDPIGVQVDPDDIVVEPGGEGDSVQPTAPETDPSDPVIPPDPARLLFTIATDQGTMTYEHEIAFACVLASLAGGGAAENGAPTPRLPDGLATTGGPQTAMLAIGGGLLVIGAGLRRRPRGAHAAR